MGRLYDVPRHSFVAGVIDETARNRVDLRQYNSGLRRGDDVYVRPLGNAESREGLGFIDVCYNRCERVSPQTITAPNGGVTGNINDGDLSTLFTTNPLGTTDDFVVVEYDFGFSDIVLFVDLRDISVDSGSLNNELWVQIQDASALWQDVAVVDAEIQSAPLSRRVSTFVGLEAIKVRVIRKGTTDVGSVSIGEMDVYFDDVVPSESQLFEFKFNEDEQTYLMVLTEFNIAVYRDDVWQADIRVPYSNDEIERVTFNQSADTMILCHPNHSPQIIQRRGSNTRWNFKDAEFSFVPRFAFEPELVLPGPNVTPSAKAGTIKLTAATALWVDSDVQGQFTGNGGEARITKIVSNTVAEAVVIIDFIDETAVTDWQLVRGNEKVWNETRGWPNCSVFHLSRLWFGGSKSRPQTLWGSVISDFFNFDAGGGYDDQAIDVTFDTDTVNEIRHLRSGDDLEVFTSGNEAFVPREKEGITPQFANVVEQDTRGTSYVPPVRVDGATFFLQKKSNILREFRFDDVQQRYGSGNTNKLALNVLNDPVSMATVPPLGKTRPNDIIYVANSDGSAGFFNTLKSENIMSWTTGRPANTVAGQSGFLAFGADKDTMYCVAERVIDGAVTRFIEKFDQNLTLDASVKLTAGTPQAVWSVPHLAGETVKVITEDGIDPEDYQVSSGGTLTLPDAVSNVEVGLAWLPLIESMPPVVVFADGTLLEKKRRIVSANVIMVDTEHVVVNGQEQSTRRYDSEDGYDEVPPAFTGSIDVPGFGTSRDPTTIITQSLPGKFNITGIVEKVSS